MSETENQYKFDLALDMIFYLTKVLLHNSTNKIEMISIILDKWNKRIDRKLELSVQQETRKYAEANNIETDVASVIVSIYKTEPEILRKEFTQKVKDILVNSFIQEMRQNQEKK